MSLTRRRFLEQIASITATGGICRLASAAQKDHPRNVLFVCLDTVRADRLGCYGHDRPTSPNLDKLAARSMVFEDTLSPSSWTLPVLASVMTGLYPHEHGALYFRTPIRKGTYRLPELLRGAGLATAAMGQFPFHFNFYGFQHGFDVFIQQWSQLAPKTTRQATEWIKERRDNKNGFFLWTHYFEPHMPYEWQIDSVGFYRPTYRGNLTKIYDPNLFLKHLADKTPAGRAEARRILDIYDGEIRCSDKYLGWVLDELERRKLLDETMIVVMADHGEHFGEHGLVEHGNSLYDPLVRVPLIIHVPGCKPGRCKQLVSIIDLFATILDGLGMPAKQSSGRSLMPLVSGSGSVMERDLFTTLDAAHSVVFVPDGRNPSQIEVQDKIVKNQKALRSGRKKLIYDVQRRRYELYDLASDPKETKDLIAGGKVPIEYKKPLDDWMTAMSRHEPTVAAPDNSVLEAMRSLGYIQ